MTLRVAFNRTIPPDLRKLFKQVPKTDLHVHIGGSTRRKDIKTFMKENGVPEEDIPKLMSLIKPTYENITDILDVYYKVPKHVFTPSQFKRATFGIVQEASQDNVKILAPRTSILNKGGEPKEIVEAVEEGLREGINWVKERKGYNMPAYLTTLAQRHNTSKDSLKSAELTIQLAQRPDSMIRSFDLAGDESKHSIEEHAEALKYIKEEGPKVNVSLETHAGETKFSGNMTGAQSIRRAIELGVDSLAHALRLLDDAELKKYVIEKQIPVQMPTWSHVQIKAVDSYPEHPIKEWLNEGMNINLVTDNRLMSQITLREQLEQLWSYDLITTWDEIKKITINGIKAAFISDIEKQLVLKEIEIEFSKLEEQFSQTIERYLTNGPTSFLSKIC